MTKKIFTFSLLSLLIFINACSTALPPDNTNNNGDNQNNEGVDNTTLNLKIPANFTITEWAKNLKGIRIMTHPDQFGNIWVSRTTEGIISMLEIDDQGNVSKTNDVFRNLNAPHGIVLNPQNNMELYFAESDKISRVALYSDDTPHKIADLPNAGRHITRTIDFGPDGRLYVSISSSCDICAEQNELRASIYSMKPDGTDFKKVASGLRNSVFFVTHPVNGEIWATDMGSDHLGDKLPPDEINIIKENSNYGWPYCYGNKIYDNTVKNSNINEEYCKTTQTPKIEIPAHSAPLGLDFIPEEGWPEEMWFNLLVAHHGSIFPQEKVGYKIVHYKLDENGEFEGEEDFITGWLDENGNVTGRPVQIKIYPGGLAYITDDLRGSIYKLTYNSENTDNNEEPTNDKYISTLNNIKLNNINPGQELTSPIILEGDVPGNWYFEAIFNIQLLDKNGNLLKEVLATAQGDWMTINRVPFKSQPITYTVSEKQTGTLRFIKANPSGLPENDKSEEIEILLQ